MSHAQLETHGSIGWLDDDGRLVIRTSSQVPFLTRDALCALFELPQERVRVFTARVGGGFGGKQEMYTEDLVAFAVLRTGRPVAYEMSRTDEFQRTAVRHPMRVKVALGASADGTLTAMKVDVLSDAGAYGNHSRGVLFHGCAESISLYNAPAKRVDAEAVYTNNVPSGAFRGYGLGQVILGVESAMDELALHLGIDPFELRRINAVREGDPLLTTHEVTEPDMVWGSYGLDQCLDLAEAALARGNGVADADRRELAGRRGHGGRDDRDDGAVRAHLRDHRHPHPRGPVSRRRRHDRVRQRHHDRAHPDRRDRPGDRCRPHRPARLRHRRRAIRHRSVRLGGHHGRRQGAARGRARPPRPAAHRRRRHRRRGAARSSATASGWASG